MTEKHPYSYYDPKKGWENTNPGWHEVVVQHWSIRKHKEMVDWIYNNVDNPEHHARWFTAIGDSRFKFRYERDYMWFRLTWE